MFYDSMITQGHILCGIIKNITITYITWNSIGNFVVSYVLFLNTLCNKV